MCTLKCAYPKLCNISSFPTCSGEKSDALTEALQQVMYM